jgi:hypothetical protein
MSAGTGAASRGSLRSVKLHSKGEKPLTTKFGMNVHTAADGVRLPALRLRLPLPLPLPKAHRIHIPELQVFSERLRPTCAQRVALMPSNELLSLRHREVIGYRCLIRSRSGASVL